MWARLQDRSFVKSQKGQVIEQQMLKVSVLGGGSGMALLLPPTFKTLFISTPPALSNHMFLNGAEAAPPSAGLVDGWVRLFYEIFDIV